MAYPVNISKYQNLSILHREVLYIRKMGMKIVKMSYIRNVKCFAGSVASIITIPVTYKGRASCHTPLSWRMQSGTLFWSILLRHLYQNNFVINHKTSVQFTASITSIWTNSLHKMDIDDYLPIRYLEKCYCRCRCFVILKPGLLSNIYFTIHVY